MAATGRAVAGDGEESAKTLTTGRRGSETDGRRRRQSGDRTGRNGAETMRRRKRRSGDGATVRQPDPRPADPARMEDDADGDGSGREATDPVMGEKRKKMGTSAAASTRSTIWVWGSKEMLPLGVDRCSQGQRSGDGEWRTGSN